MNSSRPFSSVLVSFSFDCFVSRFSREVQLSIFSPKMFRKQISSVVENMFEKVDLILWKDDEIHHFRTVYSNAKRRTERLLEMSRNHWASVNTKVETEKRT